MRSFLLFVIMIPWTIAVAVADLDVETLKVDLQALQYEIIRDHVTDSTLTMVVRKNGSLYDEEDEVSIVLAIQRFGNSEVVYAGTSIELLMDGDTTQGRRVPLDYLKRNGAMDCASYGVSRLPDGNGWIVILTSAIESQCYSSRRLSRILACISHEAKSLETLSGFISRDSGLPGRNVELFQQMIEELE